MRDFYSIVHSKNYFLKHIKINNIAQENINFYTHKIPHKILQLNFYSQKKTLIKQICIIRTATINRNYFEFKISYPYYVN